MPDKFVVGRVVALCRADTVEEQHDDVFSEAASIAAAKGGRKPGASATKSMQSHV